MLLLDYQRTVRDRGPLTVRRALPCFNFNSACRKIGGIMARLAQICIIKDFLWLSCYSYVYIYTIAFLHMQNVKYSKRKQSCIVKYTPWRNLSGESKTLKWISLLTFTWAFRSCTPPGGIWRPAPRLYGFCAFCFALTVYPTSAHLGPKLQTCPTATVMTDHSVQQLRPLY